MDMEQIALKVRDIVVEELGVREDQVVPSARFIEDLNADSLDTVELVMRFESEFGLQIAENEVENMTTVGQAIEYISSKLAE